MKVNIYTSEIEIASFKAKYQTISRYKYFDDSLTTFIRLIKGRIDIDYDILIDEKHIIVIMNTFNPLLEVGQFESGKYFLTFVNPDDIIKISKEIIKKHLNSNT